MDTFEALLEAMEAYSDAKAEYKKASQNCVVGYFLHREREALDRAKKQLKETLDAYVSRVVALKEVS